MKDQISQALGRYQRSFAAFSAGQKVVAILGTAALLLAGFLVFRWAATPDYAPLYSNLASEDAAAVVEKLEADGVPYEITAGGGTISVPRSQVYATRISLSGEGLPANSGGDSGGYALLDEQDISTSEFKEQTDFKRAMEGELSSTIEAIDGVDAAVVHLALPPKEVFADEQDPATASVLVDTNAGAQLGPDQVQAVVHLVASSIDGLDPAKVTVADSTGRVLSVTDGSDGLSSSRTQLVQEMQDQLGGKAQAMLDRVLGPGNSTVQVTTILDFDKSVTESTTYDDGDAPALSESTQTETYAGGAAPGGQAGGVVGPDGQMDPGGEGEEGSYSNSSTTRDNGVDTVVEQRETAPGSIENIHAAVVIDANAPVKMDATEVENLVASAIGVDLRRGDSIETSVVPFDTSVEEAHQAALEEAQEAAAADQRMAWIRNGGLILLVALLLLLAWLRGRKNAKARQQATTYVVEQLRADQADRAAVAAAAKHRLEPSPATMALQRADGGEEIRDELSALVERQPAEVAALLRGWLVERS